MLFMTSDGQIAFFLNFNNFFLFCFLMDLKIFRSFQMKENWPISNLLWSFFSSSETICTPNLLANAVNLNCVHCIYKLNQMNSLFFLFFSTFFFCLSLSIHLFVFYLDLCVTIIPNWSNIYEQTNNTTFSNENKQKTHIKNNQ